MSVNMLEPDPRRLAEAWHAVDPDPVTRSLVEPMLAGRDEELLRVFSSQLLFGTAGLRGPLGPGPGQMNRVLVRVAAAAIADEVAEDRREHEVGEGLVVVGFDARRGSRAFAEDTARVLAAHGLRCVLIPDPTPTPVVAFAVRHLGAAAGVMVTASHNPRDDNGYKVFWSDGVQISEPRDSRIMERVRRRSLLADSDLAALDDPLITPGPAGLVTSYLDAVIGSLSVGGARSARIAYTPLHGVAASVFCAAFARAGFPAPEVVSEQAEPDPDFPTTPFPNPEEPGVLTSLLTLAAQVDADIALANDPDGDRLAVAVANGSSWRLLTGDEVGALLAVHLLRRPPGSGDGRKLVATTVVSSRMLSRIAEHHGADYVETPTGFKWLMQAAGDFPGSDYVLGYEEALGYAIGDAVRDKDGIGAALVVAELVSDLQQQGQTLLDLLDELHRTHGVHVTGQRAIRFETADVSSSAMSAAMKSLRADPPAAIAGLEVLAVSDLAEGSPTMSASDALVFDLAGGRIVVRPSGTEPKLKVYGEVVGSPGAEPVAASIEARVQLNALLDEMVTRTADFERRRARANDAIESLMAERAKSLFIASSSGALRASELRLIATCIDLTTLSGDDTPGRIRALCARARRPDAADATVGPTAAVCFYPQFVASAKELLAGSDVRVASVAGAFPAALSRLDVRLADVTSAIEAGADEVDVVLNRSAFLDGRLDVVKHELEAMRTAAGDRCMKVILEVGELGSTTNIDQAARLAVEAGADFIKTSTGKSGEGATPTSVLAMANLLAEHETSTGLAVGLKIAGGVATADDALGYLNIVRSVLGERWMSPSLLRIGASGLLTAVLADLAATEHGLRS
ncbi:MAG: deoxyribose-phosphate aldolase [Acidimicrobiales bacterium]